MRQFLLRSWKIILFAAGYAVLVILLYRADVPIAIPVAIPAMLGTALSILLGFRTNSAYDRWWEARKIWGAIVNDSRTLGRQVISLFILPDGASKQDMSALQREMIYRQIAENSNVKGPFSLDREVQKKSPEGQSPDQGLTMRGFQPASEHLATLMRPHGDEYRTSKRRFSKVD